MLSPRHQALRQAAEIIAADYSEPELRRMFPAPVVILSAPRSGSTLLFETLRCSGALWSIGFESHIVFNTFPQLHPAQRSFDSGELDEADAEPELCHRLRACFLVLAQNSEGSRYLDLPEESRPSMLTLLEKTPRNALTIPFLARLFPDMRMLLLVRDGRETIASIMEAWKIGLTRGGFITIPNLPGWDLQRWCLLLPPGWRDLNGKSLAEIAAFQWGSANVAIIRNIERFGRDRWTPIRYLDLIDDSINTILRISDFLGIPFSGALLERVVAPLPLSGTTISAPSAEKWRRNYRQDIEAAYEQYAPLGDKLNYLCNKL